MLARYRFERLIGAGGMAEVFLARDVGELGLDRWVAIKCIRPDLIEEHRFVEMMLDEARLAARISHPNVAQVIDVGEENGAPYIVMEYLRGRPFSDVIDRTTERGEKLDFDLAARIVANACEGAHAAHELRDADDRSLGLVHRDLSPHNIVVTYDGVVKVVDFGIAKAFGRTTMTQPGHRKGKVAYMSPEQVRGDGVDRRTDVFALGLVLYEATTGEAVFDSSQYVDRLLFSAVETPAKKRSPYPPTLEAIVLRALEGSPDARFATTREMARALEEFLIERRALTDPASIATMMDRLFPDRPMGTELDALARLSLPVAEQKPAAPAGSPVPPGPQIKPLAIAAVPPLVETRIRSQSIVAKKPPAASSMVGAAIALVLGSGIGIGAFLHLTGDPAPKEEPPPAPVMEVARPTPPEPEREPEAPKLEAPKPEASKPIEKIEKKKVVHETRAPKKTAPLKPGTLDVRSDPWAHVFVDGHAVQETPIVGLSLRPGTHALRLVTEDHRTKTVKVTIAPGQPATVDVVF